MIQTCNLEDGFETKDAKMTLLIWKYKYWKSGIPCHLFNKDKLSDIKDVMDIDNALSEKTTRETQVNDLMNKMKGSI